MENYTAQSQYVAKSFFPPRQVKCFSLKVFRLSPIIMVVVQTNVPIYTQPTFFKLGILLCFCGKHKTGYCEHLSYFSNVLILTLSLENI